MSQPETRQVLGDIDETARRASTADPTQQLIDQLGGRTGMIYTAIPIIVFVTANALVALPVAIGSAVAVAVGIMGLRIAYGESVVQASGGLAGVLVAGGVAAWTGSAEGFFLVGIWASLVGAVVMFLSLLARRPLTGVVWNALHGNKFDWRRDSPSLRGHDVATLALATLFTARYVVQDRLYDAEADGWLATAKIGMGTPLLALTLVVVVWAFRRTTKRLTA
ncbi:DUF3159 domain-containing protein [Nocardia sp. NPDC058176]|uniref:DUF3159 domain-containing protein n=1 Tax=Nocardia sp. NPDC058176 TaxID=3346368 RepID=UPI0036D845FC